MQVNDKELGILDELSETINGTSTSVDAINAISEFNKKLDKTKNKE